MAKTANERKVWVGKIPLGGIYKRGDVFEVVLSSEDVIPSDAKPLNVDNIEEVKKWLTR